MAGQLQSLGEVPQILVVEDDEAGRRLCNVILRGVGGVSIAGCEEEARAALAVSSYDVVVTDLGLPHLCFTFIEELAAAGIPTVVVTAYVDEAMLDRVRGIGVHAVLTKPFRPECLRAAVRAASEFPGDVSLEATDAGCG